jgi:hypothetical protein
VNPLNALVTTSLLPDRIARETTCEAVKRLDELLSLQATYDGIWLPDFLHEVRAQADRIALHGYRLIKTSVLLPAGFMGLVSGFGFPDSDISMLGIGNHRFFLFHSAAGILVLRYLYRLWMQRVEDPGAWTSRVQRKLGGVLVGAFAVGVGLHLAVDLFRPKSIVFPFAGTLVGGTLVDDNIWPLANCVWAFKIGYDVFTYAFAEELEAARDMIARQFGCPKGIQPSSNKTPGGIY